MKKILFTLIAMMFSAQVAFASPGNDLDDLDDVQKAIGSSISAAISSTDAVTSGVNNGTANGSAASAAATAQLVALSATQFAALGAQASTLSAEGNVNDVFTANPTASGNGSAASTAALAASIALAAADDYSFDDE